MQRHTRYQGAIVRDHHLLLIRHRHHDDGRTYWLAPGGGIEPGESEEDCVRREMREETGLEVRVERLLVDAASVPGGVYTWMKTYLCSVVTGEARPGYEPEEEASSLYAIAEVRWLDLRAPQDWFHLVASDRFTAPLVKRIMAELGYPPPGSSDPPENPA